MAALVVPLKAGPTTSYKRDPNKPDSEKSILELFFDAQYDIEHGVQPAIAARNGYLIEHLGQRVRAPTTWETIQDGIDKKSDVHKRANQIETGDFSDDEGDSEDLSSMVSPRINGHTPPPPQSPLDSSANNQTPNSSTFSTYTTTANGGLPNTKTNITSNNSSSSTNNTNTTIVNSQSSANSVNSPSAFSKPQPRGRGGRAKGRRGRGKFSLDEPDENTVIRNTSGSASASASIELNNNNSSSKPQYSPIPESSQSSTNNNNNNSNTTNNNNQNQSQSPRKRKLGGPSSPRAKGVGVAKPQASVADLWFQAQAQLSEGKQPKICRKAGISLTNVRIHVQKYAKHAKRNSRVSPNDFLGVYIGKPRKSIAADHDEEDEQTDTELELSTSKSQGPDNAAQSMSSLKDATNTNTNNPH